MRTADSAAWGPGGHGQLSGAAGMLAQGLGQGGGHPPVAGHIQHVQLGCVGKLGWQNGQAVVPQGEDAECCAPSDLGRQHLQAVPVHVEVGQLGEPPKGAGQGLHRGGREGGRVKASEGLPDGMGGEGGSPSGNPAPLYRSLLPISWAGCPGKCPTPKRMLPTLALHAPLSPEAPVPTLNRPPGLGHHPPSAGSL